MIQKTVIDDDDTPSVRRSTVNIHLNQLNPEQKVKSKESKAKVDKPRAKSKVISQVQKAKVVVAWTKNYEGSRRANT